MWITKWNRTGYLVELAVDKSHHNKGIATKIIAALARRAKQEKLRAIMAETQPDSKQAMDFYLSRGFRLCGYNDRYYTNDPKSSHQIAIFFSLGL
jgi:ribosomal protein S18 acetylase RimI-like enzyme